MSRVLSVIATIAIVTTTLVALAQPAAAHERRTVGPYQFVVGWLNEPAFAGQPNSLDLRVSDPRATPAKAVEGLEKTLKVEIFYGGLTTPFTPPITTRFGVPGGYNAYTVPTKDGGYKFRIYGKIETLDVNETFQSSPTTFNDVQPLSAIQYPEQVPTGSELSKRLGDLQSTADQSRLLGIAGILLGVLALGLSLRPRRG